MYTLGTEFKINVHVDPIDNLHLRDYDFKCEFYTNINKMIVITKAQMKQKSDDDYIAIITSELANELGRGKVKMQFTAYLPDGDFDDGLRTEIVTICTDVTIV